MKILWGRKAKPTLVVRHQTLDDELAELSIQRVENEDLDFERQMQNRLGQLSNHTHRRILSGDATYGEILFAFNSVTPCSLVELMEEHVGSATLFELDRGWSMGHTYQGEKKVYYEPVVGSFVDAVVSVDTERQQHRAAIMEIAVSGCARYTKRVDNPRAKMFVFLLALSGISMVENLTKWGNSPDALAVLRLRAVGVPEDLIDAYLTNDIDPQLAATMMSS
jgi:hypothetical protein